MLVICIIGRWREEDKEFTVNLHNIVELKVSWGCMIPYLKIPKGKEKKLKFLFSLPAGM